MFEDLPNLLHNTQDHLAVLNDVLVLNQAQGETKDRLLRHIALEEKANLAKLEALLQAQSSYEVEVARDHSLVVLDIVEGRVAPALGAKLLEHLLEEQQELARKASQPAPGGAGTGPAWTVGSLIGR